MFTQSLLHPFPLVDYFAIPFCVINCFLIHKAVTLHCIPGVCAQRYNETEIDSTWTPKHVNSVLDILK